MANNDSFEQWEEEGSLTSAQRANARWKQMLLEYEAPALDAAIDEELVAFINQRKSEMPDASY
jgi:trimethylamine--corrinoid protein Co-methyltransferase